MDQELRERELRGVGKKGAWPTGSSLHLFEVSAQLLPLREFSTTHFFKNLFIYRVALSLVLGTGCSSSSGVRPAHRHSSSCYGTWAKLPWDMRNLSGPGIKPCMSPALAGEFLTTAPPEKSCNSV